MGMFLHGISKDMTSTVFWTVIISSYFDDIMSMYVSLDINCLLNAHCMN